jgi:hypothetical protein
MNAGVSAGLILEYMLGLLELRHAKGLLVCATRAGAEAQLGEFINPARRARVIAIGEADYIAGYAADVIVVSLPYHAEPELRLRQEEWIRDAVRCRLAPGGIWIEVAP